MGILQALIPGIKKPGYIPGDPKTSALVATDTIHYRVHSGHVFDFSEKFTIPQGGSVYFRGVVGDNQAHWNNAGFKANDGPIDIEFFKGPTISSLGSSVAVFNRNTESVLTPTMSVYNQASTSVSSDGVRQFITGVIASAAKFAGQSDAVEQKAEWVLAANTDYIVKLTNNSTTGSALVYGGFLWYEERTDSTSSTTYVST